MIYAEAKYGLGQVVKHRSAPFRGVVFDADPTYAHSEEMFWRIPPAQRPRREQVWYHLIGENDHGFACSIYVAEECVEPDGSGLPINHPAVAEMFAEFKIDRYELRPHVNH